MSFWLDSRGQTVLKPRIQLHGQVDGVDDPLSTEYALRVWKETLDLSKL